MANTSHIRPRGLYTFQNFLSVIPDGALLDATNVIIDRDGVIEPRRGIAAYGNIGTTDDRAKQLLTYKGRILANYNDSIDYDNGSGVFATFSSTFPEVQAGLRIKGIELNGNFYITTSGGIRKISAATSDLSIATISDAGGLKALDGTAIVDYSTAGFFIGLSKVAYRIVWGITDINNNTILGSPSNRIVVTNSSTSSGVVNLTFQVPGNATTNYFYQVYRTAVSTSLTLDLLGEVDPGDEMRQVYEAQLTSGDISAGEITLQDIVPEDFQQGGTYLYTNPNTGEGINQANEPPPVAHDIAIFKNTAFYSNIRTKHTLDLNLLGVSNFEYGVISSTSLVGTTLTITSAAHGLSNGNTVAVVIPDSSDGTLTSYAINNVYTVSNVTTNTFDITVLNTTVVADTDGAKFFKSAVTISSGLSSNTYYFVGNAEETQITFDTQTNTTDGSWFEISSADNAVRYFVWFDKTGSTIAPTVSGKVGVKVDISVEEKASKEIQDLTYTADTAGIAGNNITVQYTDGATAGSEIVTVAGTSIVVQIQAGISTATQIKTAVDANVSSAALVDITITGTGSNPQGVISATNLEGGKDGTTASTNVAPLVQAAIEAATNDFIITESTGVLTIINADTGSADDAVAGSTPPGGAFAIVKLQDGYGENTSKLFVKLSGFLSSGQAIDDTARSLLRVINKNASDVVYGYYLSGIDDVPGLMHFERRDVSDTSFSIIANDSSTGSEFSPDLTTSQTSTDETHPNRIMYSKTQQPEAVPIVNYIDVGPKDKAILRIVPLRDSLFIFKQDGIYRLTGDDSTNFSVILFDNSIKLNTPDSPGILNNQIYCLTDGGIATVGEQGVGIISRPIENEFIKITTYNYPNFSTATFGFGYETERSYYIWTVTNQGDTYATQCFRYNTFTQAWTRWDKPQMAAVVNPSINLLYLSNPTKNQVEVERKSQTRRDYADGEVNISIESDAVLNNTTFIVSSAQEVEVGDAAIQTQYVTINQFNNLLLKLDSDPRLGLTPGTFDTDYSALLSLADGADLSNGMTNLITKLNADPGTDGGYTFTGTTNFATIQTEYNAMIDRMNLDSKLKFTNYMHSSGTSDIEMTVTSVNRSVSTLTGDSVPSFLVGPLTIFHGISTSVVWAPSTFQDPAMLKHVRESTTMFESSSFRGGTIGFNTDLSPGFESYSFMMDGNGTWGGFNWGENTWGGGGLSVPVRTYIPRQKQRCRYIRSKFEHSDAFYKFSILGISYAYEVSSERAYRGKG